ncbi:MAG: BrnT family toxin [Betaproteobacteria bacterium]|nr:BrnT family toxin [Betaproteobacteria bacterium]
MSAKFQWDAEKAQDNLKKHNVYFEEAATAFYDPLSVVIPDPDHSRGENRFLLLGMSSHMHLLVVAHTDRNDEIRIISARPATRHERKYYEDS